MNELTVWLLIVFACGTGMFIYGHFFLYRNAMRLKRKQEAERDRDTAAGRGA